MTSRTEKLNAIAETKKVDAFLITSAASVKYLSGYFFYFEYGSSPFQFLPAALFVTPGKNASLVIADNELHQSANIHLGISIKSYSSYVYETPLEFARQFLDQLQDVVKQNGIGNARIGVEQNSLPLAIAQSLSSQYPEIEFVDIAAEIASLRSIKDSDEIELIRKAAGLSDIGQASVLTHAKPGITELELFNLVRDNIEASVGSRVPLMADLSSGINTSSGGGMPTNKIIDSGDLILGDFTPCLNGYWGDSCNTIVVGKPTASRKKNFALVKEALEIGINAIRPGVQAREIDALMRKHIGNYPHHSGHGVGTMNHEEPRIVPYNKTELQPNMVIALEPAIYEDDFGIRLEHLVVVTETGCEILTKFQHCFEQ
ncbi:MAG: Xaa-Pro peptidase family protein [Ginsengibacter sp.]